jgi:hypothetical protein
MKNLLAFVILLIQFSSTSVHAQAYLQVSDPRYSWYSYQGTIEAATLSVKPKGIYWEYGLYLTFSAKGTPFSPSDSLEVAFYFELPKNAIVHDSWLWIGDGIARADILDRWTAGNIYEGIVKRRRDPSILYKNSATNYELRIFPMAGNETRKVKITYLMPTEWSPSKVWASLPTKILNASYYSLANLDLLVWPGEDWKSPEIVKPFSGGSNIELTQDTDPQNEVFYQAKIPNTLYSTEPVLRFDSPLKNGRYLSTLGSNNEGIYQLAVMPQTSDLSSKPKKVALLFDYDPTGQNYSAATVLQLAKFQMINHLRPIDSFNIIYSNIPIRRVSETWLPATLENINTAFSNINISSFSNLGTLLANGVDFNQKNGNDGSLLLFSNTGQYSTNDAAIAIHDFMISAMGAVRPEIHIVDYRSNYEPYALIGGVWYYGNDYLYFRLSQSTGGSAVSVRNYPLEEAIRYGFESAYYTTIQNLDFYTSVENGFCYGRYNVASSNTQFTNKPILQVGRYQGSFPLFVEMAGSLNGAVFYHEQYIPESEIVPGDSLCNEMWYGRKIQELESSSSSNNVVLDIIQNSLEQRVLSRYTAFLCLEDSSQICADCVDETQFTDTDTPEISTDSLITAYPNPFSESVLITVNVDQIKSRSSRSYLEIYNLSGQLVRQFESADNSASEALVYRWDGTNTLGASVPAGVYILMVKSGEWSQVMKLVKQ